MNRLKQLIEQLNSELYNPVGLNILWPRNVAFLYVSGPSIYPFQSESHLHLLESSTNSWSGPSTIDCVIHIFGSC